MLLDNLAYRTARSHIRDFAGEGDELMLRHQEAMECLDCETFLQLGIDAFSWLQRADSQVRGLLAAGKMSPDSEVDEAFELLYRMWLRPCEYADKWVKIQAEREFAINNLKEFKKSESIARSIVENSDQMREIGKRLPSASDLSMIAVKNPCDAWHGVDHPASQQ